LLIANYYAIIIKSNTHPNLDIRSIMRYPIGDLDDKTVAAAGILAFLTALVLAAINDLHYFAEGSISQGVLILLNSFMNVLGGSVFATYLFVRYFSAANVATLTRALRWALLVSVGTFSAVVFIAVGDMLSWWGSPLIPLTLILTICVTALRLVNLVYTERIRQSKA
jgi:hypothetical protein